MNPTPCLLYGQHEKLARKCPTAYITTFYFIVLNKDSNLMAASYQLIGVKAIFFSQSWFRFTDYCLGQYLLFNQQTIKANGILYSYSLINAFVTWHVNKSNVGLKCVLERDRSWAFTHILLLSGFYNIGSN